MPLNTPRKGGVPKCARKRMPVSSSHEIYFFISTDCQHRIVYPYPNPQGRGSNSKNLYKRIFGREHNDIEYQAGHN